MLVHSGAFRQKSMIKEKQTVHIRMICFLFTYQHIFIVTISEELQVHRNNNETCISRSICPVIRKEQSWNLARSLNHCAKR